MKLRRWLIAVLICATAVATDAPRGTLITAAADRYRAHVTKDGIAIGATLLSASDVRHIFSTQVNECCLVVEVALYPQKDGLVEVSWNDFALRVVGQDIAAKPSSTAVIAGRLYRQAQPAQNPHDVTISPTGGIGYQTGSIDPFTRPGRPGGLRTPGVSAG